jgi:hypothetical protein
MKGKPVRRNLNTYLGRARPAGRPTPRRGTARVAHAGDRLLAARGHFLCSFWHTFGKFWRILRANFGAAWRIRFGSTFSFSSGFYTREGGRAGEMVDRFLVHFWNRISHYFAHFVFFFGTALVPCGVASVRGSTVASGVAQGVLPVQPRSADASGSPAL